MFIFDDLAKMVIDGIVDYANASYLNALQDYLKGIRMLYERGEVSEEGFRRLEALVTGAIRALREEQMALGRRTSEINLV